MEQSGAKVMQTKQQLQLRGANSPARPGHLAEIMQNEQQLQLQPFSLSIGTGDKANLAYGLPLFPLIGAARAGISSTSRSNPIVDFEFTILFSRTKFHSYYTYLMGALGPAISFELPANVTLTNVKEGGQVAAALGPNQQVVAGLVIGIAAGAGFTLTQQLYLPENWYSPWKFTWQTVFQLNQDFETDILTLLFNLIKLLIGAGVSQGTISKATQSKVNNYLSYGELAAKAFAFYYVNDDGFGPNKIAPAAPSLTIPIDLVSAIPVLKPFVEGLSKLKGEMQFGPQFTVLMPLGLELNNFVLRGAQGGQSEATYGPISYTGKTAIAQGPLGFTTTPDRFKTEVTYTARFTVALSFFFRISLCKLFSYQWTSGSLDLLALLNLPIPSKAVTGSVTTVVASGCELIPQMALNFNTDVRDPFYPPIEMNTALAGVPVNVRIGLQESWAGQATYISITISPPVSGFPSTVPVAKGDTVVGFAYTFQNRCIVSGDPNHPDLLIPPTTASPYQSYLVTAKIDAADPAQPCADWEVTAPVKVINRVMRIDLDPYDQLNTLGDAPAYNPHAGAQMNADPTRKPYDINNYAKVIYLFPFATGTGPFEGVPVDIYLLDETRKPVVGAHLRITFDSGATAVLTQPARLSVPLYDTYRRFRLEWVKASPEDVNFSSLFILVIDGGCQFGQVEFWINAWNWA
jgi:hypothetical protein